ncbi:hypothetical protein M8C21_019728, partial [Ambrosia artemisiifolia]
RYTDNVLSSSIGWVVGLIQLPPRFDYLRLHCSHPLPHTSPVPCLLPFPNICFTSYKNILGHLFLLTHFFQVLLHYRWMQPVKRRRFENSNFEVGSSSRSETDVPSATGLQRTRR